MGLLLFAMLKGSPSGGTGERSETERARMLPNSSYTAIISL